MDSLTLEPAPVQCEGDSFADDLADAVTEADRDWWAARTVGRDAEGPSPDHGPSAEDWADWESHEGYLELMAEMAAEAEYPAGGTFGMDATEADYR